MIPHARPTGNESKDNLHQPMLPEVCIIGQLGFVRSNGTLYVRMLAGQDTMVRTMRNRR